VDQEYVPTSAVYYEPTDQGYEEVLQQRLKQWARIKQGQREKMPPAPVESGREENKTGERPAVSGKKGKHKSAMAACAKPDIRREIRDRRRLLDHAWVARASDRIQQRVLALNEWTAAQRVFCYLAAPAEVQTGRLLEACRQLGKQVWAPAFRPDHGSYECARLVPGDALVPGQLGIPEPAQPDWEEPADFDLVIVPGLAFDCCGSRLGHGGGHYDRLLALAPLKNAFKIGLAFAFQMRECVPTSAHDVAMDIMVTDDAVIRCRGKQP
jgi:5-formyltetrahydrofolate cyclo-ligase